MPATPAPTATIDAEALEQIGRLLEGMYDDAKLDTHQSRNGEAAALFDAAQQLRRIPRLEAALLEAAKAVVLHRSATALGTRAADLGDTLLAEASALIDERRLVAAVLEVRP